MALRDKYGIPPPIWQAMIRDGVITSKVDRADDIMNCYKGKISAGIPHTESVKSTAEEMRCSHEWVYKVLRTWK